MRFSADFVEKSVSVFRSRHLFFDDALKNGTQTRSGEGKFRNGSDDQIDVVRMIVNRPQLVQILKRNKNKIQEKILKTLKNFKVSKDLCSPTEAWNPKRFRIDSSKTCCKTFERHCNLGARDLVLAECPDSPRLVPSCLNLETGNLSPANGFKSF